MIKKLSKILSFNIIFSLLFWKITKIHNLTESGRHTCTLCKAYFDLKEAVERAEKMDKELKFKK